MKNELARLTGISRCLAEIPAKRAVFSHMTAPAYSNSQTYKNRDL